MNECSKMETLESVGGEEDVGGFQVRREDMGPRFMVGTEEGEQEGLRTLLCA